MDTIARPLVRFNIQNAKYAFGDTSTDVKSFGTSRSITLESNFTTKPLYGDGKISFMTVNDKGKNGTLTLNMLPNEYEIAVGRKAKMLNGIADIQQTAIVPHHIYFEVCELMEDSVDNQANQTIAKVWLYNVTTTRPNESYTQNDDDTHETQWELPLTILGVGAKQEQSEGDPIPFVVNGVEVKAWQMTAVPGDVGYDTFGDAVVYPVVEA